MAAIKFPPNPLSPVDHTVTPFEQNGKKWKWNPTLPRWEPLTANAGASAYADLTDKTSADLPSINTPLAAALAAKASLESPALTGTPTAPTPSTPDDSTKIATTAHVQALILAAILAAPAVAGNVGVRWNPNPEPDITGYRVWRGLELIATVEGNRASVTLPTDQPSTLTVTAMNATAESEHSDPITVIPVTPQVSNNLTDWKPMPTFFIQRQPRQFFRFSFPSPCSSKLSPSPP